MVTALVTGGTSGIGAEFARQLAKGGTDLVLVARSRDRLESVATELRALGRTVEVMPADLSRRRDVAKVLRRIENEKHPVEILVNNAGFGMHSRLSDADPGPHDEAFDVMARSVRMLGAAAARSMRARGSGRIVNVASTAGYLTMSSGYSAIKAWVTNFSEGLSNELHRSGVTVTALCPGWVHTEFHDRAGISRKGIPSWMWIDVEFLVRAALRDIERGRVISIPSIRYKVITWIIRHLPRRAVRWISRGISSTHSATVTP
jgi:short-subunit dehydrogenase